MSPDKSYDHSRKGNVAFDPVNESLKTVPLFRRKSGPAPAPALSEHIDQNVEAVLSLQKREEETVSRVQRWVERVGRFLSRPFYLIALLAVIGVWLLGNITLSRNARWDPAPFALLDGLMTLISLVTTTIVLISQNRQTKLELQHSHLGLQVSLLTEQKASKLIHLLEELRRDLPSVKNRVDLHAEALQQSADTATVVAALSEGVVTEVDSSLSDPVQRKVHPLMDKKSRKDPHCAP